MRLRSVVLGASLLVVAEAAAAQGFETRRLATGLSRPVFVTAPPGDTGRVFVVEQHTGRIRILRLATGEVESPPFLTISGVSTGNEQGLLGLAFHPDYASNGYFYVNYTNPDTQVVRYQVSADPDVADAGSASPVLSLAQPQANHNGGWMAFGDDGFLYIATGDGGASNDSGTGHSAGGNAQDLDNLLGKILRIDVDGDAFPADPQRNYGIPASNPFAGGPGADEIWVYGLRNPWRASFDRVTGDLYIGDVGQSRCEELDLQRGTSAGGENFGWRLREGTIQTPGGGIGGPAPPGALEPIFDYPHAGTGEPCSDPGVGYTGIAITGGYVYRRPIAELDGRYFFADFATGRLWSLRYDGSHPSTFDGTNYTELTDHTGDPAFTPDVGTIGNVSSFGEDAVGNLYVLDLGGGEVFVIPEPPGTMMQLVAFAALLLLARRRGAPGRRAWTTTRSFPRE
jgi:glucose/arabinose dehydrogenase